MDLAPRRLGTRQRGAVAVVGVTVLWSAALVWLGDALTQTVSNLGLCLVALAAGVGAVRAGLRHTGRDRRFWLLLGSAMVSWSLGQAVWSWYETGLHVTVPFPSLADVGYLGLPPLAAAALLTLPMTAQTTAGKVRTFLDGLMVATSLLLCSWILVLHHVFTAGADSRLAAVISLSYPLGDVVVMSIVLTTWLRSRRSNRRLSVALPLVGTGLLAFAVADSGFTYFTSVGTYSSGSLIDVGWFAGFALILLAALRDDPTENEPTDEDVIAGTATGSMLPYAAVVAALLTSAFEVYRTGTADIAVSWMRTLLLVLLVLRQVLLLMENQALTRTLEDRVRARTAELRASRERFVALVQHSSDIVTVVDRHGEVGYQSESIHRVLGYRPAEVLGSSVYALVASEDVPHLQQALDHAAAEPLRIVTLHTTWRHALGNWCRVEVTVTNLLADPHVGGLVLNSRDVTDRVKLEEQLTGMAFSDPLTGLPNRALFKDRLQHSLRRREGGDAAVAVLFLDLDGFKSVNDMLGHGAGDELLVEVAARLRSVVRQGDTVARFGGDEFAVLLDGVTPGADEELARRINDVLQLPFEVQRERVHVAASVGIARLDEHAATAEQVLRNADLAMYQAKAGETGTYAVFEPAMHAGLVERVRLESDLRVAVTEGQFVVHYQPMITMRTGRISGVEALVRWAHPQRGLVPPNDFIPTAEATGLIRPIGAWVLREACAQTVRWQSDMDALGPLRVSVNVSPRQLLEDDFADQVKQVLVETGLPPAQLTLEMTESVLIDNRQETEDALTSLHDHGVRLAIDDFGTGYSSLSYLHRFPVDVLKIDRSFVERLSTGGDSALVSTILRLGNSLRLETVAEGIERPQEMLMLRRQGCTTGQGYHFSPPVPADVLRDMLVPLNSSVDLTEAPVTA